MSVVLEAQGLVRRYVRGGREVTPLGGLDLTLRAGEMVAVVGPSAAGKSTLARCLCLLERPDAGSLRLGAGDDAMDPWSVSAAELRALRRRSQLLPQDPVRAVSPRWSVGQVVCEPMVVAAQGDAASRRQTAAELLARVELDVPLGRRASDLSGGQVQRLVLARALACEPRLMVLDETLNGLDLRLQVAILGLLRQLQRQTAGGLALVLVSHDVERMRESCDRVWCLEAGRLVPLDAATKPP